MVSAEASSAWHLKRGQKIYSPISHPELRLLAELGHLRPDDLLWRAGLAGWRPASSVPGIPILRDDSKSKQWGEFFRRTSNASRQARSIGGALQLAYQRVAANLPNLDLIEAARRRPHQGILAGLLIIAVAAGVLDLAMKSSSAISSNAQIANSVTSKFQDRPSKALAAPTPRTNSVELSPPIELKEAEVFNVSNGHPRGGFVLASRQTSGSDTKPVVQALPLLPASEAETAATPDGVPLPTRKPNEPFKAQADIVTPKRPAQRQKVREPKQMQFGTIGYNYNPQQ